MSTCSYKFAPVVWLLGVCYSILPETLRSITFSSLLMSSNRLRNARDQFVTPVATFVGGLINLWIRMRSVDNWTDHTADHQYTEYQKNTSAPAPQYVPFSVYNTGDHWGDYSMRKPQGKWQASPATLALTWNSIKKKTAVCIYCNGLHFLSTISAGFMPNLWI